VTATDVITYSQTVGIVEVYDGLGDLITILEPTADVVEIVSDDLVGPRGAQGPPGEQGLQGDQGLQGEQGPQGPFAPQFEQSFAAAASVWVVVHNMDVFPVVTLYDDYGFEISGDVVMPDRNTVVVTFAVPMSGTARLKG
jgi:hypothetical protein